MKVKEMKNVLVEVEVGTQCDGCDTWVASELLPDGWVEFDSFHSDWGDESGERNFDACSPECFIKIVMKEIDRLDGYPSGQIVDIPAEFWKELLGKMTFGK